MERRWQGNSDDDDKEVTTARITIARGILIFQPPPMEIYSESMGMRIKNV